MKVKCGSGGESYTEGDLHFGAVMNLYVWSDMEFYKLFNALSFDYYLVILYIALCEVVRCEVLPESSPFQ